MKITIKMHGIEHSAEFDHEDITLPLALQTIVFLLEASGWSRDNIIELFNGDGDGKNNPFDWEIS